MSNIQPYNPSPVLQYRTGKALSRLAASTGLTIASVQASAAIESERIEAIGEIAGRAQEQVALLSQREQQLSQMVPLAVSRLEAIGNNATYAMSEVMMNAARRLR